MKRLMIIGLIGLVTILVISPMDLGEVQSEVSVIKMSRERDPDKSGLPPDWNPYQGMYDEMLYPVVRISTPTGIGSGVIIHRIDAENAEKSIYILTANHVVGNQSVVTVTLYSQNIITSLPASVIITDTNKDLALLRVLCVSAVKTAKLAPKDYTPFLFTPVYAVGCSLGLPPRPSSGIITVIHLSDLCVSAVEVSAPILPGNSGGPVYDANTHEVIGIAVWVHTYQGQLITTMAGVVPIQTIYEFLDLATKALRH